MHDSATAPAATSVCTHCGAAFRCGMTAGDARCWCYSLPHTIPVPAGVEDAGACLCPACLQALMDRQTHD